MSSVLCRFSLTETARIRSYTQSTDGDSKWIPSEAARVRLSPVQGEPFGPATPSGNIEMVIVNTAASQIFLDAPIGQEFDVLMTPVQPAG